MTLSRLERYEFEQDSRRQIAKLDSEELERQIEISKIYTFECEQELIRRIARDREKYENGYF